MRSLVVIYLLLTSLTAQAASQAPEEVLQEFYSWVLSNRSNPSSSLPTPDERKKLESVLSTHLINLLDDASQAEERCFDSVKGTTDKPYFFESDIFTGSWEVAHEVAYGKINPINGRAMVEVTQIYINSDIPKADRKRTLVWVNKVEMRNHVGLWLIHDLRYSDGSSLISAISKYLHNSKKWCRR